MRKLRVLDLFSGIGGFSLGLERTGGFETAAFCEYAEFPRKVLAKHWPDVPIYPDIRDLTAERLDADGLGPVDLICGGYPCQPFSHAGKRLGAEDDRHLWPEMRRLVETLRPAWVIGENVAGHISMGLDDVLSDLGTLGYACQAFVIPACAVNAPHRRDRVWVVAHSVSQRPTVGTAISRRSGPVRDRKWHGESASAEWDELQSWPARDAVVADTNGKLGKAFDQYAVLGEPESEEPTDGYSDGGIRGNGQWSVEPDVGRVAHGVPHRVDRLKALGNAVVPQIPEMIGHAILQSMETTA
jgi:DNA (cytosine-5)-methyltransferase 1